MTPENMEFACDALNEDLKKLFKSNEEDDKAAKKEEERIKKRAKDILKTPGAFATFKSEC